MSLLPRSKRPMHLGPFPMEKIKRVEAPTTLILDDEVKRVPRRADGFERARHGDFGPSAQKKRQTMGGTRAAGKNAPLYAAISEMLRTMVPQHSGDAEEDKAPIPEDPAEMAKNIKSACYFLDASDVGICEVPEYAWYSHQSDGTPIEPYHKYAIVMLIDQGYETSTASSGDDWISGTQSLRAYMRGAEIGDVVASYIRKLGYSARCHSAVDSDVLHLPLILKAGLGELSRIGEVVIHPYLGPRFKSTVVTTDLPLALDMPIDFGLQDFCSKCMKCARECPVGAIPYGDKIMYNGYETWKPDVQNCTSYRVLNARGRGCGRCLKVCPWNKVDFPLHNAARWAAINLPWARRLLARLDDLLGFGNRNPIKKWWFDHDNSDGKIVEPDATNRRDIRPSKKRPSRHDVAYYRVEDLPPGDHAEAFPFDRKAAIANAGSLETPAEARVRASSSVNSRDTSNDPGP